MGFVLEVRPMAISLNFKAGMEIEEVDSQGRCCIYN